MGNAGSQGPPGPPGSQGPIGPPGLGIQSANYDSSTGNLTFTRTDNTILGSFPIREFPGLSGTTGQQGPEGPQGLPGPAGPQGIGIESANYDQTTGNLKLILSNNTELGPFMVRGPIGLQGPQGDTGLQGLQGPKGDPGLSGPKGDPGLSGATGATGPQGLQGIGIESANYNSDTGNLTFTRTNNTQLGPFMIRGPQGLTNFSTLSDADKNDIVTRAIRNNTDALNNIIRTANSDLRSTVIWCADGVCRMPPGLSTIQLNNNILLTTDAQNRVYLGTSANPTQKQIFP
jgi:hypothetical protein